MDARSSYSLLLARGGRASDYVAVVNLDRRALRLNLYAADASNAPDGSISLAPRDAKPTDAASWVHLQTPSGKPEVIVPPRSTVIVPFTLRVPANAPVGDHLAGLVTSIFSSGQSAGDRGTNLQLEQRVAVRLGVRVAGPLTPRLSVEGLGAAYAGTMNPVGKGQAVVTYTVRNTGNVRLGGKQTVTVHGPLGSTATATPVDVPLLLPGGSASVTVDVPGVLPLVYLTADVSVTALVAVGDADPPIDVATASAHFWAPPWTMIALLLLASLLGGWFVRRRRMRPQPPVPQRARRGREAADSSSVPDLVGSHNSLESAGPVA